MGNTDVNHPLVDSPALRQLPQVDEVLRILESEYPETPRSLLKYAVQQQLELLRAQMLNGTADSFDSKAFYTVIREQAHQLSGYHLRRVINATGVVLHTNLGRAELPTEALRHITETSGYSNLEYRLETGERGERYEHVEALLRCLTGAEAALVVNNNAAALFLVLNTLAQAQEVVISRGELVEIGGSFRVPEIIKASGCNLVEVGTTNKTHLSDYRAALSEETRALLKVHTSNYRIRGFTQDVEFRSLRALADEFDLPLIYDLGSGLLFDLRLLGIGDEPTVIENLNLTDILCFSGDKLMGGPQTGIILGKKCYIERLKKNQMLRMLRVDKTTLAALEATLRLYLDADRILETVPVLRMLAAKPTELLARAEALTKMLAVAPGLSCRVEMVMSAVGGGSLPDVELPSWAVAISRAGQTVEALEQQLRRHSTPVIARIHAGCVLMDMRTVEDTDLLDIAAAVQYG